MNKLLIIALIAVVLVSGCANPQRHFRTREKEQARLMCTDICESNNYIFNKTTTHPTGAMSNFVYTCYCKDSDGAIKTFVM